MFNKVVLVGRLTQDPELRYTNNGIPIARYSLAVNRNYKNAQGAHETDFLNIVCWRKLAEISAKYLKKGKLVLVEGRIQSRKYQAQDGSTRTAVDIQAEQMQMLDSKGFKEEGFHEQAPPPLTKDTHYSSTPASDSNTADKGFDEMQFGGSDDIDFEDVPF